MNCSSLIRELERIDRTGIPKVKGTKETRVIDVVRKFAWVNTREEMLELHPHLSSNDLSACLAYAYRYMADISLEDYMNYLNEREESPTTDFSGHEGTGFSQEKPIYPKYHGISEEEQALVDRHVESKAGVKLGKPCIRGTRVMAERIVELLAREWKKEDIMTTFGGEPLTDEEIRACLLKAAEWLQMETTIEEEDVPENLLKEWGVK